LVAASQLSDDCPRSSITFITAIAIPLRGSSALIVGLILPTGSG
jgi:hypothetical protein